MSKRRGGKQKEPRARARNEARRNQGIKCADGPDRKGNWGQKLLASLPFKRRGQSSPSQAQSNARPSSQSNTRPSSRFGWRWLNPFVVPPLGGKGARNAPPPEGGTTNLRPGPHGAARLRSGARGVTNRRASGVGPTGKASRRGRLVGLVASVLILSCIATSGIIAGRGSFRSVVATRGSRLLRSALQSGSPTPSLSKEYIYAGGKLIATEEPGANSSPTPTPTATPTPTVTPTPTPSPTPTPTPQPGAPVLTGISPALESAVTGGNFQITLNGSNLAGVNQIVITPTSGQPSSNIFEISQIVASASVVTAQVVLDVNNTGVGSYSVQADVVDTANGVQVLSNSEVFTLTSTCPGLATPTVSGISVSGAPQAIPWIGQSFTLTVNGANFLSSGASEIYIGGQAQSETQYISSTQLRCTLSIAQAGLYSVSVVSSSGQAGCASPSSGTQTLEIDNPIPEVSTLSPPSVLAGSAGFTLGITGLGFYSGTVVQVNGSVRASTFISTTQLTVPITAADIASAGPVTIRVSNQAPGGGAFSATLQVITPPVITAVSPPSATAGLTAQPVTISGSAFASSDVVSAVSTTAGSQTLTPSSITAASMAVSIPQAMMATGGTVTLTVTDKATTLSSLPATFTVNNPLPVLTGLNPASLTAGTSSPSFTISGSGFVPTTVVEVNGSACGCAATINTTSQTISTTLTAAQVASVGPLTITVFNPTPVGGTSNSETLNIAPTPPAAPSALTATAISPVQINLAWTNNSTIQTAVLVQRMTGSGGSYATIATIGATAKTYLDTSLTANTEYFYQVVATNGSNSPASNQFNATTYSAPPSPLGSLSAAVSTSNPSSQINLNWTDSNADETGIKLERAAGTGAFAQIEVLCPNTTSFSDTTVAGGTVYTYRMRSYNSAGDSAYSGTASAMTGTSMVDRAVEDELHHNRVGVLYAYLIDSGADMPWRNAAGLLINNGAEFNSFPFVSLSPGSSPPAVPVGLAAWAANTSQINVSWVPGDTTQTGFTLQRSTTLTGTYSTIATLCAATVTYSDTGLTPGATYYYEISAFNANGDSANSSAASAETPTAPAISNISPSYVLVGTPAFNLTVNGSFFDSSSVVNLGGTARVTTFTSASQLSAALTTADLASPAQFAVTVVNPSPAPASNAVTFNVVANNTPTITSLSPPSATAGSGAFTLTVNGANYVSGSVVKVGGSARTTTFAGPGQLTAAITASDVASTGTLSITVANPSPGSTSSAASLPVNNPPPVITSITPLSGLLTGGTSTVITGTGFLAGATVSFGGTAATSVTVSSGTSIAAKTPAHAVGAVNVVVTNTDSQSSTLTNGFTFAACPSPTVNPSTIAAGTAGAAYTQQFTSTGGAGTITYTETGALPAGVTFTSAGVLSGTPQKTGSFAITVTATDSNGCTGSRAYTLVINCQTIIVSPPTVPVGVQYEPYQTQFTQTGAIGAVTFSTTSALPTGLTLSSAGLLSGTPTVGGAFSFTVTATDSNGCKGSITISLSITALNKCLLDTGGLNFVQFNTTTGNYLFTHCGAGGFTLAGTGTVSNASGVLKISDVETGRNVAISYNAGSLNGTAVITITSGGTSQTYRINDTSTNPVCVCGS
jgi:hypothetical protein